MKNGAKALILYDHKLLYVLRDNNPDIPWPNTWNVAGGGIEEAESDLEALKRELKEEVNITPTNIYYLGKIIYPEGRYTSRFLVKLTEKDLKDLRLVSEGQEMKFFTLEEVVNLPLSTDHKEFLIKNKKVLQRMIDEDYIPKPEELELIS